MQNATTRRRLTELLPITITWGEIFFDALASRSLQDPWCPSITNISTSSYIWSAVIYCNKKVLMSPSIFLTISQTSNICHKKAGSVWPSVQLTVEPGQVRWNWLVVPESWMVWASCTGAQAEGGYRPNHLPLIRSHRQPAKILPSPCPGFRMVELGYHIVMANTFCCSAG